MTANEDMVLLTTCSDTIEASMLHQFLGTAGIHAFVQGESHRSVLGILGTYVELRVLVPQAKMEAAREALRAFQTPRKPLASDDGEPFALQRRKRLGIMLLVSLILTFGCGHFYLGAWRRGLMFAITQLVGLILMIKGAHAELGAALLVLAVATDAIGGFMVVRTGARAQTREAASR